MKENKNTDHPLPIYLIDSSNINHTNIAASTWSDIAPHWNRTTQYSNLLSLATTVSSLRNQYDVNIKSKKRRQIILIHCSPKMGSTTLREACHKNMKQTCPQINFTTYLNKAELGERGVAGYFGRERLVSVMNKCVDTYYFCVNQIKVTDMLTRNATTTNNEHGTAITATMTTQNVEYVHLFPFRNYNDWVKSGIKQLHDRGGKDECEANKKLWHGGKCEHSNMEPDIRKYSRVDLDRFHNGVVRQMNGFYDKSNNNSNDYDKLLGEQEVHTFLLYLHKDLQRVMELVSTTYNVPMLPGTGSKLKGERPDGTCNESLVEQYHGCFSDELMEFKWDLQENQVWRPNGAFRHMET